MNKTPVMHGIVEREEFGQIILSPANAPVRRRILHVNSYGGPYVWGRIKQGLVPAHQLLGCLELVRMGYEVALVDPLRHFAFPRQAFPHDLKHFKMATSWLRRDDIIFSGHTLLYWLPLLKGLRALRQPLVSLTYAREHLDWARLHTGIITLTPAAEQHAKKLAPRTKVANLGWGADLQFFKYLDYRPTWFFSCGIANRDFKTLSLAATQTTRPVKVICPGSMPTVTWPSNVEVIDGGPGWLTDKTKNLTARDIVNDLFPSSAGTLIVMKNDPTEYTANGFTNLIEAMAVGQPVIVTRTGALPGEIDVEKVGCGLHVPPENPKALADAMEYLAANPKNAMLMGRTGRQLVESRYNLERYSRDLHRFFENL